MVRKARPLHWPLRLFLSLLKRVVAQRFSVFVPEKKQQVFLSLSVVDLTSAITGKEYLHKFGISFRLLIGLHLGRK